MPIVRLKESETLKEARETPSEEALQSVLKLTRPNKNLWKYYALGSLLLGPFFFFALIPLTFRFRTLRYSFDDEGVSMRWGILFRREISLNYSRIQDIHLRSNVIQRWLGLGDVKVQTASGSAGAEMSIEGFAEFELVRDFLYSRMRGAKHGKTVASGATQGTVGAAASVGAFRAADNDEVVAELRAARKEIGLLADRLQALAETRHGGGA